MINLNEEVIELQKQMKIKPDLSNVRQRLRNASMATKVKYKRAIWKNVGDNLASII